MKLFFSVGEPSGDLHAANLIRALRQANPQVECVGYGGPQMAAAGCQLHFDLTTLAVMWFARVLLNIHRFWNLVCRASAYFRHHRPDAVVLVDFPGFNWWIASRAKAAGVPVFYYCPPQLWAWAPWRIQKMRKYVDYVLCPLPFEYDWYQAQGCRAVYVGHPFFDEVRRRPLDPQFMAAHEQAGSDGQRGPLVAILPGSRTQEVTHNLHTLLAAARLVRREVPDARFLVASFKPHQAELAREQLRETDLPAEVCVGRTPEIMALASCALAVSGSVSLELLHYKTPTVIVYRLGALMHQLQKWLLRVRYITLVNLLSVANPFRAAAGGPPAAEDRRPAPEEALFPEFLTTGSPAAPAAAHIVRWLRDPSAREARLAQMEALRNRVGAAGASQRAAAEILARVTPRQRKAPHFTAKQGDSNRTRTRAG